MLLYRRKVNIASTRDVCAWCSRSTFSFVVAFSSCDSVLFRYKWFFFQKKMRGRNDVNTINCRMLSRRDINDWLLICLSYEVLIISCARWKKHGPLCLSHFLGVLIYCKHWFRFGMSFLKKNSDFLFLKWRFSIKNKFFPLFPIALWLRCWFLSSHFESHLVNSTSRYRNQNINCDYDRC